MTKIKILLAFDHELPLGGLNENYDKAIFEPTQNLIELSNKINVKINLFTDILSAHKFKTWDYTGFYEPYKKQLQLAVNNKHDVQLHIHPHWLTTSYSNKNYLPSKDFKLSDFINSKEYSINSIIKLGKDELVKICEEVNKDYKCIAYRAGGFNMEPNSIEIVEALLANNIFIDSSIAKEMYFKSNFSELNYRNYNKKGNWYLNPKISLSDTSLNHGIYEIPVGTSPSSVSYLLKHLIRKKVYSSRMPLNVGKTIHQGKTDIKNKINSLLSIKLLGFDVYTFNGKDLLQMLDWHINNNEANSNNDIMVSTVSHPKNMGTYSLQLMDEFIDLVRNKYKENVEFCTFRDVFDTRINKH